MSVAWRRETPCANEARTHLLPEKVPRDPAIARVVAVDTTRWSSTLLLGVALILLAIVVALAGLRSGILFGAPSAESPEGWVASNSPSYPDHLIVCAHGRPSSALTSSCSSFTPPGNTALAPSEQRHQIGRAHSGPFVVWIRKSPIGIIATEFQV